MWSLDLVLMFLDKHHPRATADAVAPIVGWRRETFMISSPKDWGHSWVVHPASGLPDDYPAERIHPCIRENPLIIADPGELVRWIDQH